MASRQAIAKVRREVFGQIQKKRGVRTGSEVLEKRWTGIIEARYYPESITPLAKKVRLLCHMKRTISQHMSIYEYCCYMKLTI